MKKPNACCRYCGRWKADRRDDLGYPVCGLCSFMLYGVTDHCLLSRADAVLTRYRAEWAKNSGKVAREVLAYKGAKVAGQIRAGLIEARCKCALCNPILPGLLDGGADAQAV